MKKDGAVDLQWMEEILRNPPPVDRWFLPLFIGFQPSKVVQDFFHPQGEQTHTHITANWYTIYKSQKNSVHGLMYNIYIRIYIYTVYIYMHQALPPPPPPMDGSHILPPYEIFPLPPRGVVGVVVLSLSPPCGVVGVWYCPPPPLWCGGGVVLSPCFSFDLIPTEVHA